VVGKDEPGIPQWGQAMGGPWSTAEAPWGFLFPGGHCNPVPRLGGASTADLT